MMPKNRHVNYRIHMRTVAESHSTVHANCICRCRQSNRLASRRQHVRGHPEAHVVALSLDVHCRHTQGTRQPLVGSTSITIRQQTKVHRGRAIRMRVWKRIAHRMWSTHTHTKTHCSIHCTFTRLCVVPRWRRPLCSHRPPHTDVTVIVFCPPFLFGPRSNIQWLACMCLFKLDNPRAVA